MAFEAGATASMFLVALAAFRFSQFSLALASLLAFLLAFLGGLETSSLPFLRKSDLLSILTSSSIGTFSESDPELDPVIVSVGSSIFPSGDPDGSLFLLPLLFSTSTSGTRVGLIPASSSNLFIIAFSLAISVI